MEKPTPHHDLTRVQAVVERHRAPALTKSALDGGRTMELTTSGMLVVIGRLTGSQTGTAGVGTAIAQLVAAG